MIGVQDDPDLALSMPLQPLYEELTCPICFQVISECTMTPCGHNFCSSCISKSLQQKDSCPVCHAPCSSKSLLKNLQLDRIISLANSEKEKASKKEFSKLSQPGTGVQTETKLKPLEEIFRKHLRKCMVAYDERYTSLVASREAEYEKIRQLRNGQIAPLQEKLKDSSGAEKDQLQQSITDEQRMCQAELTQVQQQYDKTFELLLSGYDQLLEKLIPAPSFLPVIATLTVSRHPELKFPGVMLQALDHMKDIEDHFVQCLKVAGNPLMERGGDLHFVVHVSSAAAAAISDGAREIVIDNPATALHEYRLAPNSEIELCGSFKLQSDMPKGCFAKTFKKDGPNEPMDYFTCRTCKTNWICRPCAEQCHVGHDIIIYLKQHKSTWACCYCKKTKCCKHFPRKNR